jgi:preprotein translocase subunit SecB
MVEAGNDGQAAAPAAPGQPNLNVMAQYVKDLSFENPGAPAALQRQAASPTINVAIGVQSNPMGEDQYEVDLKIEARAVDGETTLFVVELSYGGVFRLINIPAENVQPITLIECPRLLFPFARQIVSDASRNGGFPPLLLDPVDFVALYRQRMAQQQPATPPPGTQPS